MAVVLTLFALAADDNDLSSLKAGAGPDSSATSTTNTTTSATTDASATIDPSATTLAPAVASSILEANPSPPGSLDGVAPGGAVDGAPGATTAVGGAPLPTSQLSPSTTIAGQAPGDGVPSSAGIPAPGDEPAATVAGGGPAPDDGSPSETIAGNPDTPAGTGIPSETPAGGADAPPLTASGPARSSSGGGIGLVRILATVAIIGAATATVVYLATTIIQAVLTGRRRGDEDDLEDPETAAVVVIDPSLAGWTLEQLRQRLEAEPDPRQAIRHAYSAVESGFGAGGGMARRQTESALQYLERTLSTVDGATQPLRVLTGLFLLARFSNRPINEAMRRAAINAVVELQARFRLAAREQEANAA